MSDNRPDFSKIDFTAGMEMLPSERAAATVLVVEPDSLQRNNMRTCLKSLGYGGMSDAPNHVLALERMEQRNFTHVLFDAKKTNMPPNDFLKKLLEMDSRVIAIPTSYEPSVDDVFELFVIGARGFLVKPFTMDTVEASIMMATKGEPISDLVLQAKDRNEALVAIMMGSLDKVATVMRQAKKFDTAKREIPKAMMSFRRSSDLACCFRKGSDEDLVKAIESFCIERSKGPATRLGRLRKRLKTTRS